MVHILSRGNWVRKKQRRGPRKKFWLPKLITVIASCWSSYLCLMLLVTRVPQSSWLNTPQLVSGIHPQLAVQHGPGAPAPASLAHLNLTSLDYFCLVQRMRASETEDGQRNRIILCPLPWIKRNKKSKSQKFSLSKYGHKNIF